MTDHISGAEAKQYRGGLWLLPIVGALSVVAGVIILFKPSESLATLAVIAGIFLAAGSAGAQPSNLAFA